MALAFTNKTTGTATASPGTSASVAFANSTLYILSIGSRGTSGTGLDVTGVTGGGLTWVKLKATAANVADQASVWVGYVTSGASTGTLSITVAGTISRIRWTLEAVTGSAATAANNGSDGFVQSAVEERTAGTTSSAVALAAFADATNNAAFGFTHVFASTTTINPETTTGTYTVLGQVAATTVSILSEYLIGQDTSVTASWTGSAPVCAVAAEVKAAKFAPPFAPRTPRNFLVRR